MIELYQQIFVTLTCRSFDNSSAVLSNIGLGGQTERPKLIFATYP